ncbi:MAG TPA: hypothetical protein VN868_12330 [Terriglobales bacterium]|nr:hypothetical protein [Terriglobales bacterium]
MPDQYPLLIRKTAITLICLLLAAPAWGEVLLRWTEPSVPRAARLGVGDLVVRWNSEALIRSAHSRGYRVYAEVLASDAATIAGKKARNDFTGIILNPGDSNPSQVDTALQTLRAAYPRLSVLILNTKARQPDMKGQLVIKKDGVLQVTSPTAQPWIDTNLALIRLEKAFHPAQDPVYEFQWDLSDPLQQERGPDAADYQLAVAEAGAFHASLVMDLHSKLQTGLAQDDTAAWAEFNRIKPYLAFYSRAGKVGEPDANVGVLTDNLQSSYEPINLWARHNIPFDVLKPSDLNSSRLGAFDVLVVFAKPDEWTAFAIADFASRGGTAVLVDSHGSYPWQSAPRTQSGAQSVSYAAGKGSIIELSSPVIDPEIFSQDIRRLIVKDKMLISLWNSLTTVAVSSRAPGGSGKVVELVNYAQEPLEVQVRVKGSFTSIRYETPEGGCCQLLAPVQRQGFTEFVVPSLRISGRVHLDQQSPLPKPNGR